MNDKLSATYLQDPSFNQVKLRKQHQLHEYVVPSSQSPTLPTNLSHTHIMKNTRNSYKKKRFSLPPPTIREEEEILFSESITVRNEPPCSEEDDEDIPLAVLAYRRGFKVPVKVNHAQHVYPNENLQGFEYPHHYYFMNPCYISPTNVDYHNHKHSLYKLSDNSGLSFSPSSSNSSLSSIENTPRRSKSSASKYIRRQSSHI